MKILIGIAVTVAFLLVISEVFVWMLELWTIASSKRWVASHTSDTKKAMFENVTAAIVTIGSILIPLGVMFGYALVMTLLLRE